MRTSWGSLAENPAGFNPQHRNSKDEDGSISPETGPRRHDASHLWLAVKINFFDKGHAIYLVKGRNSSKNFL
jgi:hypothetical protein